MTTEQTKALVAENAQFKDDLTLLALCIKSIMQDFDMLKPDGELKESLDLGGIVKNLMGVMMGGNKLKVTAQLPVLKDMYERYKHLL